MPSELMDYDRVLLRYRESLNEAWDLGYREQFPMELLKDDPEIIKKALFCRLLELKKAKIVDAKQELYFLKGMFLDLPAFVSNEEFMLLKEIEDTGGKIFDYDRGKKAVEILERIRAAQRAYLSIFESQSNVQFN